MTTPHPRRTTAARLASKIEAVTSIRFPVEASRWRFESIRGDTMARVDGQWRWRLVSEPFGLEVGSEFKVNEVLSASRLVVVPEAGKLEIQVETFG